MVQKKSSDPVVIDINSVLNDVRLMLQTELSDDIQFHDWAHTENVLRAAQELGKAADCSEKEMEWLSLAAIFHDTGYSDTYEDHETVSKKYAENYLQRLNYPKADTEQVLQLIEATRFKYEPTNKLEKIIRDADLSHLGQRRYKERMKALRKEQESVIDGDIKKWSWREENLDFLKEHSYHTEAARNLFSERKAKNIDKLEKRLKKKKKKKKTPKEKEPQLDSLTDSKTARMLFKTALRNHIDLTNIADQKANMMLSINAIILTIGMPLFANYIRYNLFLSIPAVLFLLTCAITMTYATLATRPIKMDGTTDLDKINSGRTNLFFFGNFYKIDLPIYQETVSKIVGQQDLVEKSVITDLYYLGQALGSKYRQLRTCYTVFIVGFALTVLSFILSYFIYYYF